MTEIEFNNIFATYRLYIFNFAYSRLGPQSQFLAEEITSYVFIKLWKKQPVFETNDQIKAWLFISTKRRILDIVKAESRKRTRPITEDESHITEQDQIEIDIAEIHTEFLKKVIEIIKDYTDREQTIFNLFYLKQLKAGEIARILKTHPQTVSNQILWLKNKLKSQIKSHHSF